MPSYMNSEAAAHVECRAAQGPEERLERHKAFSTHAEADPLGISVSAGRFTLLRQFLNCHAGLRKDPKNRVERHKEEEKQKEPDHEKADKVDGKPVGQPVGSEASLL